VDQCACPLFVPLAEEGWTEGEVPRLAAERYLRGVLSTTEFDAVILGCTHYPLLRDVIVSAVQKFSGSPTQIYDSAAHAATTLREAVGDGVSDGGSEFLVSDDPQGFLRVAERFLGERVERAEHVEVG
jgi:glutamate racemase